MSCHVFMSAYWVLISHTLLIFLGSVVALFFIWVSTCSASLTLHREAAARDRRLMLHCSLVGIRAAEPAESSYPGLR